MLKCNVFFDKVPKRAHAASPARKMKWPPTEFAACARARARASRATAEPLGTGNIIAIAKLVRRSGCLRTVLLNSVLISVVLLTTSHSRWNTVGTVRNYRAKFDPVFRQYDT